MSSYSLTQPKKRILQPRGSLSREELNLQEKFDKLQKQFSKLENRYDEATSDAKKFKSKAEVLERELITTRKTLEKVIEEKYELEHAKNEQKLYVRKLETKISQGAKGQVLSELNSSLQSQMEKLEVDKKVSQTRVKELEAQVEKLNDHIIILSRALEIKAEEFGLQGDIRSTLLYDVGQSRDELEKAQMREHEMAMQLRTVLEDNEIKSTQVEELRLIRESNNEELNRTLQQLVNLQAEFEGMKEVKII
jgi:chromosome segregation ATPase